VKARVFDPSKHCGAKHKRDALPCRHPKGFRTDHLHAGNCWLHGGSSPNGKKYAGREQAQQALIKLGIPLGDGDPIKLLGDTVRHVQGLLEASAQAVLAALEPAAEAASKMQSLQLEAALDLYLRAIKEGHRAAKASVDANIAERMAVISERQADVILRALQAGLDAAGVHGDSRALAEAAVISALRVKAPVGAELN
jgi:hypothetical protein